MSVAFSVRVYGTVDQQPPYAAEEAGQAAFVQAAYTAAAQVASFPSAPVNVWPILPGAIVGGVYCYSVIEEPASGLQVHSTKYIAKETVAAIASLRG